MGILYTEEMKFVVLEDGDLPFIRTLACRDGKEDIYHDDIKKHAERVLGKKLKCPGGGRIRIDHQRKLVTAYGKSGAFGPAKSETVRMLLAKVMEDEGMKEYALAVDMKVMDPPASEADPPRNTPG